VIITILLWYLEEWQHSFTVLSIVFILSVFIVVRPYLNIDITWVTFNLSFWDYVYGRFILVIISRMFLFFLCVCICLFPFIDVFRQSQSACVTLSTRNKYEEEQNQSFSLFSCFFSATQETTCHAYLCLFFFLRFLMFLMLIRCLVAHWCWFVCYEYNSISFYYYYHHH
jgi:hypothetical protein